ncbi:hypothetical protein FisN_29Hh039 [Fistulifera solaris]|uniref:HSF-type DNA-binding domain-containing protein n=1 Tax=Fistulifera solaris TaxID=1519565 RepID=A0A1Z5K5X4_FISSO|nr:hypothetical protein FisN_29Hh039 [Fistulifera solaris]|eukprot:GAX21605.1 hypothetical protein FisN_29Hh039 [Fistulifera solaris]
MMGSHLQPEQSNDQIKRKDDDAEASSDRKREREPEIQESIDGHKKAKGSSELSRDDVASMQLTEIGTSEQSSLIDASDGGDTKETATEIILNGNSFPERLFAVIHSGDFKDAIRWSADGKCFGLIPRPFVQSVLKTEFQGTKLESFQRKLSRWQFSRCLNESFPPEAVVYRHQLFRQDKPELVRTLVANKKKEVAVKKKAKKELKLKRLSETKESSLSNTPDSKSVTAVDRTASHKPSSETPDALLSRSVATHLGHSERGVEPHPAVAGRLLHPHGRMLPDTAPLSSVSLEQARRSFVGPTFSTTGTSQFASVLSNELDHQSVLRLLANQPLPTSSQSLLAMSLQGQRFADESTLQRAALAAAFERPPVMGLTGSLSDEELQVLLRAQQLRQDESRLQLAQQNHLALGLMPPLVSLPGPLDEEAALLELYLRRLQRRRGS